MSETGGEIPSPKNYPSKPKESLKQKGKKLIRAGAFAALHTARIIVGPGDEIATALLPAVSHQEQSQAVLPSQIKVSSKEDKNKSDDIEPNPNPSSKESLAEKEGTGMRKVIITLQHQSFPDNRSILPEEDNVGMLHPRGGLA